MNRRQFLLTSSALAATPLLAHAQPATAPSTGPFIPIPKTPAAAALKKLVGDLPWATLHIRLKKTNADIQATGLRAFKGSDEKLLTGYPYNEYYDWDLYFENLYLSYYGVYPYCFSNLKQFLDRQQPDGYINRSLTKQRDRQHFKPFMAQLVVLGCRQNKDDYKWVAGNYYTRLKKYLDKWFSYDGDKNGLPAWNSADAAGTDNQWSRAGALGAFEVEGVDLASYLVREYQAMAVIADRLGEKDDHAYFLKRIDEVNKLINDVFWDEKAGLYFDRNEKKNTQVPVKSATNFMPLFCGAPSPAQAKRMITDHLLNEKEFWLKYPVASYSKTEPDYYQGSAKLPNGTNECNWRGSTWAPTNYMIFQGLMRYGFTDIATDLASRLFEMAIVKNDVLREYYNAETGEGLGQTKFWGFTALYYVMLLETQLKFDASSLDKPFRPIIPDELGISFKA